MSAGQHLGIVLATVVSALDLSQIVLSGPMDLLDDRFRIAAVETIHNRTFPTVGQHVTVRFSSLGDDDVLVGAARSCFAPSSASSESHHQRAALRQRDQTRPRSVAQGADNENTEDRRRLGGTDMVALTACGDDAESSSATDAPEGQAPAETTAVTAPPAGPVPAPIGEGTGEGGDLRLWLNGGDTPDDIVEYAVTEFNKIHPDVKVELERQQWTGIVERLTTALSGSDAPDVVEFGNTQAQAFEAAGALTDLTRPRPPTSAATTSLQSLLEAGTYDGKLYGVPYYAGARIMIYRKDLFEASGIEVPTTLDEMVAAGEQLKADNADVPNFSGIYLPGQELARRDVVRLGARWRHRHPGRRPVGRAARLAGVDRRAGVLQGRLRHEPTPHRPTATTPTTTSAFCAGEVGMMPAPGWKPGQIINPEDGCPDMEENIGVFAMPGADGRHDRAGVPRRFQPRPSRPTARTRSWPTTCSRSWSSSGYQKQFAEAGTIPAIKSELGSVSRQRRRGRPGRGRRRTAASCRRSEKWAGVEAANVLPDMLVADRPGRRHRRGRRSGRRGDRSHPQRLITSGLQRTMAAATTTTTDHHDRGRAESGRSWRRPADGHRRCPTSSCCPSVVVLGAMLGYPLVRLVTLSLQEYGLPQVFGQPAAVGRSRQLPHDPRGRLLLDRPVAHADLLRRQRRADDGARRARRPAARGPRQGDAVARVDVADHRLGDAGADRDDRLAVDLRHRVRPRQLGARPAGRKLVGEPADVLLRRHDHRRVDGHPVRRLHGVRRR